MNKNTSMSYYFNKITDMIKQKVYVEKGPLEEPKKKEITVNNVKKYPLLKDINAKESENIISTKENSQEHNGFSSNSNNLININQFSNNSNVQNVQNAQNLPKKTTEDHLKSEFNLLPSETIFEYEEKITLRIEEYDFEGYAIITDYRLVYKPNPNIMKQQLKNPFPHFPDDYFEIPIFLINKIEKSVDKKNSSNYILEIQTKDNRIIKLVNSNNSKKFYGDLAHLANPKNLEQYYLFAMNYRDSHPVNTDGWNTYDPLKEFDRQGVQFTDELEKDNFAKKLRLTFINENYEFCSTYPKYLAVPSMITDEDLKEAGNFRTKSRVPNLCFYNKENNASMWRSSQTRGGLTYQRNEKDEKLLSAIYELNLSKTDAKKLIIYDARPYLNALANRFKGAGFENTDYYKNAEICFCEIDNIHCVRNALVKINQIVTNPKLVENKNFHSNLEASTWNNFIYQIIKSAVDIANSIKNGYSVLIHCSDGWDRSSQLTSLAQLLIDPYYRTIEGFATLIEKEWLSFGHQFGLRNGFYHSKDHSEDQRAPIFLQWLDCIHQILFQFPHLFEFNMDLLLFIAFHTNSCKYGTFIFNSEFERSEKKAELRTVSIWTDVLENKSNFINPFYNSEYSSDKNFKYLLPNFAFYKIRFWEEYFLRYYNFNTNFSRYYGNPKYSNLKDKNKRKKEILYADDLESKNGNYGAKMYKNPIKANLKAKSSKIQTSYQYIELERLNDFKTIQKQKEEIEKLTCIVKEISSKIIFKIADYKELSSEAKECIKELNNGEVIEEDGYVVVRKSSQY